MAVKSAVNLVSLLGLFVRRSRLLFVLVTLAGPRCVKKNAGNPVRTNLCQARTRELSHLPQPFPFPLCSLGAEMIRLEKVKQNNDVLFKGCNKLTSLKSLQILSH
jgi:hypothetical protein